MERGNGVARLARIAHDDGGALQRAAILAMRLASSAVAFRRKT
jgi:hypothetical protein